MGSVPLGRAIRSLQYRLTRFVNLRSKVLGPLWQGRFKSRLIADQRYFEQLLAYIHLNPVSAGIVADPAEYRWSGHRDLLGDARSPVVDVDEVLRLFGKTRRSARAAYVRTLNSEGEQKWNCRRDPQPLKSR